MSTAMERYIELVKQYPGQEQVNLTVEIEVPGSWFGVGSMGSLTTTEQREKYNAQAVEYSQVRKFPGASRGARKTKEKAIRFICLAVAADEPSLWSRLLARRGLPLQDQRVLLRSSLASVRLRRRGQQTVLPRRDQRAFSRALTTHRGSTWSRLCELIPTPTIPSRSSSLRRPSMSECTELHCALSTEHSECSQHSVYNKS